MQISITKGKNKPHVLTCKRKDGTITWTKLQPGLVFHDLIHYAVESVLGYKNAFYGLLKKGFNIQDFELPRTKRPKALIPKNLPYEAIHAEFLVGLFQMEIADGKPYQDFNAVLREVYAEKGKAAPAPLESEIIESIRLRIRELHDKWVLLTPGECLSLDCDW